MSVREEDLLELSPSLWKLVSAFQNSLSGVDDLIKKHEGFAKTLEAQEEKIDTLEQLAQTLLAQEHYASDHIRSRCQGVLDRRDKVKQVRCRVSSSLAAFVNCCN